MLRIIQNTSAGGAQSYYSTSDYYTQGQELEGVWRGAAASRLGVFGIVKKEDWDALCDNRDPATGSVLTQRQKTHRRIGYDFNFHVPKSVSLLYGLTKDERIVEAFRESVRETMQDMETEMKTRVRVGGKNEDRTTGNMIWGEFVHTTARPVDGIPDPHLHAHAFVFNTTWDEKEGRWKAGQFADLKRDAPYFEAVYHSRLARRLGDLGLSIERTKRGWESGGFAKPTLEKFSRRTALIEAQAKEKGISDAGEKSELGAKTRERKRKDLTFEQLREEWASRLSSAESSNVGTLAKQVGRAGIAENDKLASEAVVRAVEHCFERNSVLPERRVMTEALKRSVGVASPGTVARKFAEMNLINGERDGQRLVTTGEVLDEEQRMIDFARDGRGTCPALGDALCAVKRDWLNDGQRRAIRHLLTSNDKILLIRGAAGTGKTSMAQEAVEAIEAGGKRVFMFAPSAEASRGVLRDDGFANADTVARLLLDQQLQEEIRGQVIWIDEAGLLGTRQMAEVFDLTDRLDARLILSGDRKQHGSVERGAALRLLEQEAGLVSAEIREIQRQKGEYKEAVKALSEGRTEDGFRRLDKLGWVREVNGTDRYKIMATDYVSSVAEGKKVLVVSPTHLEGEWITDAIRAQLKESGRLGMNERSVLTLQNLNLTEAERTDPAEYEPGDVAVYHQNSTSYGKGERVVVGSKPLPIKEASKFQVFRPTFMSVAPGDILRVTRNATTMDGKHRLNNGQMVTVKDFDQMGNIILSNDWKVAKDFGHLASGYVVTSHSSQSRTVDRVLIGESARSYPAASPEQFYVSVSRGRERATIYTDDKQRLIDAVSRSHDRLSATELVTQRQRRERVVVMQRVARQLDERSDLPGTIRNHHEGVIYDR
jgi:conjugative relaxase-like TrwC/TraI family protein